MFTTGVLPRIVRQTISSWARSVPSTTRSVPRSSRLISSSSYLSASNSSSGSGGGGGGGGSGSGSRIAPTPVRTKQQADEDIQHRIVCLVDPASGSLLPAAPLRDLLASLDRTRFTIHLVDPTHDPPICKIIDRKEQYTKQQARKALNSAGLTSSGAVKGIAGPPKEVQVTWGVSTHDLGHKLGKAKELLAKGHRVSVVITAKKGADTVDAKGRAAVIQNVKDVIKEIGVPVGPVENKGGQVIIEFKRVENI